MNKKILAILLVAVFILPSIGIGISVTSDEDVEAASKGVIVVETSPDFAPYDYYYGTEFVGIDMDILRAIGMDTGYTIEFKQNRFDSIITSVTAGNCDMGASGFTITKERKKTVNFTDPYTTIKQVAVGKPNQNITSESDLHGKNLVAQLGTSGEYYILDKIKAGDKGWKMTGLNTYSDVVLGLLQGAYEFEIVDEPVARAQVAAHPGQLQVYDVLEAPIEEYGFLFNKANTSLLIEINNSLNRLIDDGTVDKILKYYSDNGYRTDTPSYFDQEPTLFIVSDNIAPYSYNRIGETVGIDADILTAVADKIGYKIRFIDIKSAQMLDKISASPNYIGAGSLAIRQILNEKGEEDFKFSESYGTDKLVVVSPNGVQITGPEGLNGKNVAVISDSQSIDYVKYNGGVPTSYSTPNYAIDAVNRGEMDLAVVDYASAKALSYGYGSSIVITDCLTDAPISNLGFLFSASATDLIAKVNGAINELKSEGVVDDIKKYYADNEYNPDTPSYFDDTDNSFWGKLKERIHRCFFENDRWELYLDGLENTLKITVVALLIGLAIGILIAAILSLNAQNGRLVIPALLCRGYVTIIRGTPVMVQLLLIYYVVFASSSINPVMTASVAFGINSGAYIAEIVRSGINSVPKGQTEAAKCLGLNNTTTMKTVVVPQAIRNILPALGNESIALLKETSIAGFIGIIDLTRAADIIRGQTYDALVPLIAVALIYLVIVLFLQFLIKRLERRLNNAY